MTAHPWFTAIVALWFAALLGLSSLVLAPAMLERIVAASGIDSFIAAAAPPLGQTARLLMALGLAGMGGVLGLILGGSLAARAKFTRPGAREVVHGASKGPIVDEAATFGEDAATFGEDAATFGEDAPGLGLRDRLARLTGQGDGPRDFADLPKLRARDRHPDAPRRKPLTPSDDLVADDLPGDELVAEPLPADDQMPVEPDHAAAAAAVDVVMVAQDLPASDEPLELDMVVAEVPVSPLYEADPAPAPAPAPIPALAGAMLGSLGVVQLTERLAIAMQARRERDARRRQAVAATPDEAPIVLPSLTAVRPTAPAPAPAPAPNNAELGGEARKGGYSSLLDLSRRPSGDDTAEAGDPVAAFAGPTGGSPRPGPFAEAAFAAPVIATPGTDAVGRDGSAPARFPAASDPVENYRALKAALDSIQRLSGTR